MEEWDGGDIEPTPELPLEVSPPTSVPNSPPIQITSIKVSTLTQSRKIQLYPPETSFFSVSCLWPQIIVYILSFLHASDRKEAALVCRRWYTASQDLQFQVLAPGPQTRKHVVFICLQVMHTERGISNPVTESPRLLLLQRNVTFCFPASASSLELIRSLGRKQRCRLIISQLDGFSMSRPLLQEVQ